MSAADIRNPAKLRPAEADRVCLTCHLNQPTHVGRINSSHAKNQVGCVACHSIHKNGPNGLVARKAADINQLCAGCHTDVWASFQRPYKHRLPEGAMSCVDCHNPHGSVAAAHACRRSNANEPGCFKCHGDKRGPFTFEHAPVRLEGCAACHEPHGSANPRMLTRAEVRFVCLECHANLPAPTLPANGTLGTVPPGLPRPAQSALPELQPLPPEGAWLLCEPGLLQMRFLLALLLIVPALGAAAAGPHAGAASQARRPSPAAPASRRQPLPSRPKPSRRISRAFHRRAGSPAASISAIAG